MLVSFLGLTQIGTGAAFAQQFNTQKGVASDINLVQVARQVNMQDMYARALYQHIRANPAVMDNPQFYVGFLAYLLSTTPNFQCHQAFSNEFERRDYFTQAFTLKDNLVQVVNSVPISDRFDVSYTINTGNYDFTTTTLPFSQIRSIGSHLSRSIDANQARNCASQMLSGTTVDINLFPWRFEVVNEAGEVEQARFPFGQSLQLSSADARVLFERFGRQLYSIVSYQFQAANNGERKIQVVPTDAQLFGLSTDAVVQVKSFAHPALSRQQYLDITNPLEISIEQIGLDADLVFQQQGYRAVGTGTRQDPGTDITLGGTYDVNGSAAVGSSTFIIRLAVPQLMTRVQGLYDSPGAQRYLTLFGSVEFGKATATAAPVSGQAIVLQVEQSGELREAHPIAFDGRFRPAGQNEPAAAPEPSTSLLDDSPVEAPQSNN